VRGADGQAVCSDELAACFSLLEALTDSASPMSGGALAIYEQLKGLEGRLQAAYDRGATAEDIKSEQGACACVRESARAMQCSLGWFSQRMFTRARTFSPAAEALDAIDAERMAHGGIFAGDLAKGPVPPGQAGARTQHTHNDGGRSFVF
jgi:hypothetical protein